MGEHDAQAGLELLGFPLPDSARIERCRPIAAVGAMESTLYLRNQLLRDTDWASMAHSVEVRTPLVDASLSSIVAPLSALWAKGEGKRVLASAAPYGLPDAVKRRRKTGFSVPLAAWLDAVLPVPQNLGGAWDSRALGAHWSRRLALSLVQSF
jgi:asparagine synthase (glutamine-hydrolysing)